MSEKMRPIAFEKLMNALFDEYAKEQSIFGMSKLFRKNPDDTKLHLFKETLELPFGVSSGSHTQLAQNIITAYAAGSRYIELKTIQIHDNANVPKPSISAIDECYNVTSSTELTSEEAMNEYIKAWYAIKLISKELELGDENGFIFNMSLGFNVLSIKSDNVNKFIDGLMSASTTPVWKECKEYALNNLDKFQRIDAQYIAGISDKVSTSATLSTHHGCKTTELEEMSKYLIGEKKLNLYIKCAPTLVGYEAARRILNNLGYDYVKFDDRYFLSDLQLNEAIPMFKRLMELSESLDLEIGVKITNTLKVSIKSKEFMGEEMYMSGKALFPLAISSAKLIANTFDGKLPISYCGGADVYNVDALARAGLWPVTLAATLLKPGGYTRLNQIAESVSDVTPYMDRVIIPKAIEELANASLTDDYYRKPKKAMVDRKINDKLPLTNCFKASCRTGCPIKQDIPAMIRLSAEGRYTEALEVMMERNPLPNVTAIVCLHPCTNRCVRNFYDKPVTIKQIKSEIVRNAYHDVIAGVTPAPLIGDHKKVAIVGGGPAGMSAAYFLARGGVKVTIYERADRLGGMVSQLIPEFRVPREAIEGDIDFLRRMGIRIELDTSVDDLETIKYMGYTHIILAMGAWVDNKSQFTNGTPMSVVEFLRAYKNNPEGLNLGDNVTIIGGGNSAVTAARAAKRVSGVKAVRLVSPTTKRYMVGDEDEIERAEKEGVEIWELLHPFSMKWRSLDCRRMEINSIDSSGRPNLVDSGSIVSVTSDTVISAVGEKIDDKFYRRNGVATDERGNPYLGKETLESVSLKNTYVIGDGNHGPATVVEAIADAQKVALAILGKDRAAFDKYDSLNINPDYSSVKSKKGKLHIDNSIMIENEKCLECRTVCETCVDVCPNRANISLVVAGLVGKQIIHIGTRCNSCGNCEAFCLYNDAPFRTKLTVYNNENDYRDGNVNAFMVMDKNTMSCKIRVGGVTKDCVVSAPSMGLDENIRNMIVAFIKSYPHLI